MALFPGENYPIYSKIKQLKLSNSEHLRYNLYQRVQLSEIGIRDSKILCLFFNI